MKNVVIFTTLGIVGLFAASGRADTLGTAGTYAVLGASTVTNTGSSVLTGDLGLYPGTSVTGFPPGSVIGTINNDNGSAQTAQSDALAFYTDLAGLSGSSIGANLGGQTLTPGVYSSGSGAFLLPIDSVLTLNFDNESNMNIVLQATSTLTTISGSSVNVENLGANDNVYYQVGSSATLGTYSTFLGDIIANTNVTLDTGANITCGSAIALTGAVTLDTNTITNCSASGSDVSSMGPVSATPEPGTLTLLSTGLLAGAGFLRRRLFA
jgi:type VI secretion system secreted protein VgrG